MKRVKQCGLRLGLEWEPSHDVRIPERKYSIPDLLGRVGMIRIEVIRQIPDVGNRRARASGLELVVCVKFCKRHFLKVA